MFKKIFTFKKNKNADKPVAKKVVSTPENTRIYAIGDIHGRVDLLRKIHQQINNDLESFTGKRKVLVYIGDYIDRGYRSKEVIDEVLSNDLISNHEFEVFTLKGNHEFAILKFLSDPEAMKAWIAWGGDSCLRSYNIELRKSNGEVKSPKELAGELAKIIPVEHLSFFEGLRLSHEEGDYFFVHAGLRPEVEIAEQYSQDMLMIREDFIYSNYDFGKTVVFGHTIFEEPYQAKGRIGIDTGAYASGVLTCAVLEGEDVRFLQAI